MSNYDGLFKRIQSKIDEAVLVALQDATEANLKTLQPASELRKMAAAPTLEQNENSILEEMRQEVLSKMEREASKGRKQAKVVLNPQILRHLSYVAEVSEILRKELQNVGYLVTISTHGTHGQYHVLFIEWEKF